MGKKKGIFSALLGGAGGKKSSSSRASKSKTSSSKGSAASKAKPKTKTAPKSTAPKVKNSAPKPGAQTKKPPTKATRNKNVSKRYPNGRTLQTRDEYFYGAEDYRKPDYEKKGNYRKVVVVDSNKNHDLAVVKLTTSSKGKSIPGEKKSKYRPFVETKDEKGQPIRVGKKFIENPGRNDLSSEAVTKIKKDAFKDSNHALSNRKRVRKMKGREN